MQDLGRGSQDFIHYFWHSAYTLSVESHDLFRGIRGHAPPERFLKEIVHFKVYSNQIFKVEIA